MQPELAQKLAHAVDSMPAFPKSVQKVIELTRNVDCTPKALVDVIELDPVITVKILRVANSAHYNLPKQVTSLGHAIVYLGFNTVKNLSLSIAAIGVLPKTNTADFDIQKYLIHSLSTATIAKRLAALSRQADPMDCFIAGLLHDFGKIVLLQFMPIEFKMALTVCKTDNIPFNAALIGTAGVDHALVGAMLAEKWRFSAELVTTIRHQRVDDLQDTGMTACVFAANQISKKLEIGFGGNHLFDEFPPSVKARLGGTLDESVALLGDMDSIIAESTLLAQL
ncbi:HDOD domain-containing protein [Rhodoferax aquaticus]|uniref:HDOD domain-containing protein n=1 Tax=Rhodoferax aquaticus TaxID=2527691 RepID=A0A515ENQ4_9BURK|nr:HDOD domain-containing protein [Rhodoferax aquaticus]QDL54306.1 HDOD domain-containing protein [Rhodoferax aquaticus]